MLCIGVNKIKIHFDTSQLCCGVVHSNKLYSFFQNYIFDLGEQEMSHSPQMDYYIFAKHLIPITA